MRFVKRPNDPPEGFEARAQTEYDKVVAHRAGSTPDKSFSFGVYKRDDVKRLLHQMFHGKCAYCETFYSASQPMDVEHFRPKGAVAEDDDHPGYWWLAMKWDNLLPSCIDCNRKRKQITPKGDVKQVALLDGDRATFSAQQRRNSGKKDSFPIAETGARATEPGDTAREDLAAAVSPDLADEQALLLNPCREDPATHLLYHFTDLPADAGGVRPPPVSFVLPQKLDNPDFESFTGDEDLSLKGATSIHVYGLNRLDLVQARTEVLRRLEFLKTVLVQLHKLAEKMEAKAGIAGNPAETRLLLDQGSRMVRGLADEVVGEIARMSRDDGPYCSMVRAWREQFEADLRV